MMPKFVSKSNQIKQKNIYIYFFKYYRKLQRSNNQAQTHDRPYVKFEPKFLLACGIIQSLFNKNFKASNHDSRLIQYLKNTIINYSLISIPHPLTVCSLNTKKKLIIYRTSVYTIYLLHIQINFFLTYYIFTIYKILQLTGYLEPQVSTLEFFIMQVIVYPIKWIVGASGYRLPKIPNLS